MEPHARESSVKRFAAAVALALLAVPQMLSAQAMFTPETYRLLCAQEGAAQGLKDTALQQFVEKCVFEKTGLKPGTQGEKVGEMANC